MTLYRQSYVLGPSSEVVVARPIDYSSGDAQFFKELPLGACELRPVLDSEVRPEMHGQLGLMMLVCRSLDGAVLRATLRLPAHRRKNIFSNVQFAIGKLRRFKPGLANLFDKMSRGRSLAE